jgi:hypothetical protein
LWENELINTLVVLQSGLNHFAQYPYNRPANGQASAEGVIEP